MRLPWHKVHTESDNSKIVEAEESMERAERMTHVQSRLTELAETGRDKEFIRIATGAFIADITADRTMRRNM